MQKKFVELDINIVHPSPTNPRKRFDQVKLQELANSIEKHEVMQPIVVRPMPGMFEAYEIVAGERRWRGSKLAKKTTVPAMVQELTDLEVLQLQVIENAQRDDLHPLEEAKGYKAILDNQDTGHWNVDQLAEKVGKSRSYIYNTLKLNDLCLYAQDMFLDGRLGRDGQSGREIALLIARIPGEKLQTQFTKEICGTDWQGDRMSYRTALRLVQDRYTLKLSSAPFKITDPDLLPSAGSCKECPHRSGNAQQDFPDIENPDVCTNPDCFNDKKNAYIEQLKMNGSKVVEGAQARKLLPGGWDLHGDYVKLSDNCPGSKESFEKILGHEADYVVTIINPTDGKLVTVAKKEDVKEALQEKGIDVTFGNSRNYSAEEKEKERQVKIENVYRLNLLKALSEEIRPQLEEDFSLEDYEQTIVARTMLDRLDHETCKKLLRFLSIPFTTEEGPYKARKQLDASIAKMTSAQRMLLILQLALIGDCCASGYNLSPPENLLEIAKHHTTNPENIRAEAEDQLAPKSKAKKNPETVPPPIPAAQAQDITAVDQAKPGEPVIAPDVATADPLVEDVAPGAPTIIEPAETAVNPSPASQEVGPEAVAAPLSGFEKARLKGEAAAARRKAIKAKKESGQPDIDKGADQEASANHTH